MQIISKDQVGELLGELFKEKKEVVEVMPDVGVNVIELSATAAINLSEDTKDNPDVITRAWVAACCVDDEFNPIFTVEEAGKLPGTTLKKLFDAVVRVNSIMSTTSVEEAEKNSEEAES